MYRLSRPHCHRALRATDVFISLSERMRLQLWHVPQEPVVSMVVLQAAPRAGCVQGPLQPVFFLSPFFKVISLICSPEAGIKLASTKQRQREKETAP